MAELTEEEKADKAKAEAEAEAAKSKAEAEAKAQKAAKKLIDDLPAHDVRDNTQKGSVVIVTTTVPEGFPPRRAHFVRGVTARFSHLPMKVRISTEQLEAIKADPCVTHKTFQK